MDIIRRKLLLVTIGTLRVNKTKGGSSTRVVVELHVDVAETLHPWPSVASHFAPYFFAPVT